MSTCWNDFDEQAVVSQDDSAAVQAYQNTSGTYGASTANPSFEEGWNWWGFGNSGYGHRGIYYGGQDNTRRKGRFSAANTSSQSYIYSTTRLSHKTDGHLVMRNTKIKARANYKKAISASSGSVVVSLRVRAVDYVDGVWDAQCQMVLSANLNQSTIGSWVTKSVLAYPTTSWNYRTTGVYTVGYTIAGTTAEAVDARVYVYNRLKFDGGFTSMDVDRVRVLVDRP